MPDRLVHLATSAVLSTSGGRSVSGLIVPWSVGRRDHLGMQFDPGSLTWAADVTRIPLLFQHDHNTSIGHATSIESTPAGLRATFDVEDSPAGDRLLREAQSGSRTGFSIGVVLDNDSIDRWWNSDGTEDVPVSGELVETSHVSVPAFDDARIDDVTEAGSSEPAPEASAGLAGATPGRSTTMPNRAAASTIVTADLATPPAGPPAAPVTAAPIEPDRAAAPIDYRAAAPMPALSGAAHVVAEPDVYRTGGEHSFVRDAFRARLEGDVEAGARLRRFNAQLVEAAAATRGDFGDIIPPGYRGELLIPAIDAGRPLISRLGEARITLTDATPFTIPAEGDFDGVGDHVEGTAHVAAGTYSVDGVTVTPGATSGAYEISRELVDSSNPAIDRLALNAMMRDYRGNTESKAAAAYGGGAAVTVHTGHELEVALLDFTDGREGDDVFIGANRTFYSGIGLEEAADGRPRYPAINPANTSGTSQSRFRGVSVQGVDLFRAGKVPAAKALGILPADVLWGESAVTTFRFDEVLGPGVIKLALWAYTCAAILRPSGVKVWTYAAPVG